MPATAKPGLPPAPTPPISSKSRDPILHTTVAIPLLEVGDSEYAGVARLTPRSGRIAVFINVNRRARDVHRPVQVRTAACDVLGEVKYALNDIVNRKSLSHIAVGLETMRDGGFVISGFEMIEEQAPFIVCGSVPTESAVFTIALVDMNDSEQSAVATLWPRGGV